MPPWEPPGRMATLIDLTSDDIDVRSSETIDLTSADYLRPSENASQRQELKVEDESSTLVGSSTTDSGVSSPNTQRTDDIARTESNPTDPGDLSPRNPLDEDSDSSDDDLAAVLARNRKRKIASGDAPTTHNKFSSTQLAPAALVPVFGSNSLKPAFGELWFNRSCRLEDSGAGKSQQGKRVTVQQETQSANDANSKILNIDRGEVFGSNEKTEKHKSKPKTQRKPAKQQSRIDVKPPITPAPRRAVSENPELTRPREKTRRSGVVNSSQPREGYDSQPSHKRHKPSRQDDTISISDSRATALEDNSSQVAPADRLQARRSETHSVERDSVTGKYGAFNIQDYSSGYRSDDARIHRENRARHEERRRKKHMARAWKQTQKSQSATTGRHKREKSIMLASQNGRGQWKRSGYQRVGMASQLPPKTRYDRGATAGQDSNPREVHHRSHGVYSGTTRAKPSTASGAAHIETAGQDEDVRQAQEISQVYTQQSQHVHGISGQRESGKAHLRANAAEPATRLEQPKQTLGPDPHKRLMEQAKHFFENHPSNTAPQRRVKMTDFIPPDLSKPSFSFRSRMVDSSNGKRLGRKLQTAAQLAEKRDKDRQRRILTKRQQLEEQAKQQFPNESDEYKEKWIEDGIAKLKQVFTKNDQKREAQKSQGLLTVKDLEDVGAAGSDRIDRPSAAAPKGKRRGIPVAEALEPGATINLYVVYISDPVEKGKALSVKDWKRLGDQFFRKEDANKHAETLLRDERYDDSHLVSIHFRVGSEDSLFFGTKELADGNQVQCMVEKERHIVSYLDLGDTFVRKELKETYCSRFDVFYTNVIPKVFANKDKTITDQSGEDSRAKSKSEAPSADAAREPDPSEKTQADDDKDSLFSATPTPEPETARSEEAEPEEVEGSDDSDDSDADSVATDETLAASEPGGNLGVLSWNEVEYEHEHVCGFTTMELANQEAYKVARELWKPRGRRMNDWLYYKGKVMPAIQELKAQELDVKAAKLVFDDVPEFEGHVDDRPWRFIHSTVFVKETRLEGPRNIGNHIVMDNEEDSGEEGEEDEEDD